MKYFRYPINFYAKDLASLCTDIAAFLGDTEYVLEQISIPVGDSFLVGPVRKFKSDKVNNHQYAPESTRFISTPAFTAGINKVTKIDKLVARGYYLPHSYTHTQLPLLVLYKEMRAYGNKPVIISENFLRPGELVLVPETVEVIATLSFYDEVADRHTQLPEVLQGVSFYAKHNFSITPFWEQHFFENKRSLNHQTPVLVELSPYQFEHSFFEERDAAVELLSDDFQFGQFLPVLNRQKHDALLNDILKSGLWVKRHGDTYMQMSLDILELSLSDACPASIREVIAEIKNPATIAAVSRISGIQLSAVKEICAFRMSAGQLIDFHEDNSRNGELLVRFNWLLHSPVNRKHDLRFKRNGELYGCQSLVNSATIFRIGKETPHDVSPVPLDADSDRINILLTFGN